MGTSSLCPGYGLVEAFGPDEAYVDEQEVSYVTLDLGTIEPTLVPSSSTYRLIGLDTPTPFLQLSGTIFKGQHDSLLGTELLFADETGANDRTRKHVSHVATAEQRIHFKEVELRRKSSAAGDSPSPAEQKGKGKAKDKEYASSSRDSNVLDRMTGRDAPVGRSNRKEKGKKRKKNEDTGDDLGIAQEQTVQRHEQDDDGETMDVTQG